MNPHCLNAEAHSCMCYFLSFRKHNEAASPKAHVWTGAEEYFAELCTAGPCSSVQQRTQAHAFTLSNPWVVKQRNASFSHSENQGESSRNILHKGVGGDFESLVWTYQRQIMPKHEGIFSNTLASENHIAPPAWYLTALMAKIYQQQSLTHLFLSMH